MILAFHTASTGIPLWNQPSSDPRQPHLVDVACVLIDETTLSIVGQGHRLVIPDGWTIPPEAAAVQPFTADDFARDGVTMLDACEYFLNEREPAATLIAYGYDFHRRIVRSALHRCDYAKSQIDWGTGSSVSHVDIMQTAKADMNLAPSDKMMGSGRRAVRPPKHDEAHRHYLREDPPPLPSPLERAISTARIYITMKNRGIL